MDKMFIHGLNPQRVIEWRGSGKGAVAWFIAELSNGKTYEIVGNKAEQMIELFQAITIGKGAYDG
jgi:hypothetical protein